MSMDLERFVAERVDERFRAAAGAFIALVAEVAPELTPGMRGGTEKYIPVPVWRRGRDVVVLSPSKKGVTVSFANGAMFDDPEGLLGGAGKVSRTTLLRTVEDAARPALAGLLRQAVERATD